MAGWFGWFRGEETTLDQALAVQQILREASVTGVVKQVTESDYSIQVQLTDIEILWNQQILETHDMILRGDRSEKSPPLLFLQPGNRICVTGDIRPFSTPTNPGEFDQKSYYRVQGVDAILDVETCRLLDGRSDWLTQKLMYVKQKLREAIGGVAEDSAEYGLYMALLLGDKQEMGEETQALYQTGGISHLLAISGLHLSLIGMGVWKILRFLRVPLIPAGVAASGLLLLYVGMVDGSASAWRAWIMFTILLVGGMIGRTYDMLSALGLAGILLLWEQPLYAFQAGFQLSFGAMAGIGIVSPVLQSWWEPEAKRIRERKAAESGKNAWLHMLLQSLVGSIAIQLATLPITAYHFYQLPIYGIFLNLLAIPLMTYALSSVLVGTLVGMVWLPAGIFITGTAHYIFQVLEMFCRLLEKIPGAVWVTGQPKKWQIFLYYMFLAAGLIWQHWRVVKGKREGRRLHIQGLGARTICCVAGYLAAFCFLLPLPNQNLRITMLDVGQGDSIVLQLPGGAVCLIDGGSTTVSDVGERRILPYLKQAGIHELEMIFLTHEDSDHINGIVSILEDPWMEVKGLALPAVCVDRSSWENILNLASEREIPVYYLEAGDLWSCAGVDMKVLHPSQERPVLNANSTSLVLELTLGEFRALFMGDLESEQEMELLEIFSDVDLLKVGHHGSRGSTCTEFLAVVQPELALVSYGSQNLYGHPHPDTLKRLRLAGCTHLSTGEYGAIVVEYEDESALLSVLSLP